MREAQSGLPAQNGGPSWGALRSIACAASAVAGLICIATLIGWFAGLPLAASWGQGLAAMKPITALAVLLTALAILPQFPLGPPWRIAFGVIAALLGALSLVREFGGPDLQIASSFVPAAAASSSTAADFPMSPATALAVVTAGAAAALLPISRLTAAARFLAASASVIAVAALLDHFLGCCISVSPLQHRRAPDNRCVVCDLRRRVDPWPAVIARAHRG